jgi:hypothetical protein
MKWQENIGRDHAGLGKTNVGKQSTEVKVLEETPKEEEEEEQQQQQQQQQRL